MLDAVVGRVEHEQVTDTAQNLLNILLKVLSKNQPPDVIQNAADRQSKAGKLCVDSC